MKVKVFLADLVARISIKLYYQVSYFYNRKLFLNITNPKNLSEIILSKIISGEINKYAYLADKYKVREFVENRNLSQILPTLIGVWDDVKDINFDDLPPKFALKLNFGCGFNIICLNKTKLDIEKTKKQLSDWLNIQTFWRAEPHYDLIKHCIICEEFIEDNKGLFPIDYKFMCINGKPHHILIITERDTCMKLFTYDLKWNKVNYLVDGYVNEEEVEKPENLDVMIESAIILSEGFDFVRVDLYDTGDRVLFGEMTFTPQGGLLRYYKLDVLDDMGSLLNESIF